MCLQLSVSSFPHLPKHTWYLVIYTSRIGENHSTSHHLGGKSQSGTFYPPNRSLWTTLVNGCIHKSYTFDFIWVNNENLWSPKALSGKIWVNCSNSYFYPKNCQVSTSKELSKTKKNHKFSLLIWWIVAIVFSCQTKLIFIIISCTLLHSIYLLFWASINP